MSEIFVTSRIAADPDAYPPVTGVIATERTGATFQINNVKLYVPIATLLIDDDIKFLENIKQEFKRTIFWNKHRSEKTIQPKNNNLII